MTNELLVRASTQNFLQIERKHHASQAATKRERERERERERKRRERREREKEKKRERERERERESEREKKKTAFSEQSRGSHFSPTTEKQSCVDSCSTNPDCVLIFFHKF